MGIRERNKLGRKEPRRILRESATCLCPQIDVDTFVISVTLPTFKSLLSPLLALVGYELSLSLSSLICKMRIIAITISLRALMIMYINHLA